MKRTLFVTSNRLGDAVLTTGVLYHLLETEPDSKITVVCGQIPQSLFEGIEGVEKVIGIKKRKHSLHWWDAAKAAGHFYWHRIVDFRASPFSIFPARHRHIWRGGAEDQHKVIANAAVIGVKEPLAPKIVPPVELQDKIRGYLNLDNDPRPILALGPTANYPGKQWHKDNYVTLAQSLIRKGGLLEDARIVVFGAPGEEEQGKFVAENLPEDQVIDLVGKTTPLEAATYMSFAQLFVGNDSGLMHCAVASNIPTVGLFGIGQPKVYGPWGDSSLCLTSTPADVEISVAPTAEGHPLPADYVLQKIADKFGDQLGG